MMFLYLSYNPKTAKISLFQLYDGLFSVSHITFAIFFLIIV